MDLTTFLLARIAEDEAVTRLVDGSPDFAMQPFTATRVLAECEAKRRSVEDFEILHADYRTGHDPSTEARRFQARVAMSRLASVYADHPDYRDEWRP